MTKQSEQVTKRYKNKVIQRRTQGDVPGKEKFIKAANLLERAIKTYEKGQITHTYLADYFIQLNNSM